MSTERDAVTREAERRRLEEERKRFLERELAEKQRREDAEKRLMLHKLRLLAEVQARQQEAQKLREDEKEQRKAVEEALRLEEERRAERERQAEKRPDDQASADAEKREADADKEARRSTEQRDKELADTRENAEAKLAEVANAQEAAEEALLRAERRLEQIHDLAAVKWEFVAPAGEGGLDSVWQNPGGEFVKAEADRLEPVPTWQEGYESQHYAIQFAEGLAAGLKEYERMQAAVAAGDTSAVKALEDTLGVVRDGLEVVVSGLKLSDASPLGRSFMNQFKKEHGRDPFTDSRTEREDSEGK